MKFAEPRPHADPEKAARRIVGIVSTCAALVPAGSSLIQRARPDAHRAFSSEAIISSMLFRPSTILSMTPFARANAVSRFVQKPTLSLPLSRPTHQRHCFEIV